MIRQSMEMTFLLFCCCSWANCGISWTNWFYIWLGFCSLSLGDSFLVFYLLGVKRNCWGLWMSLAERFYTGLYHFGCSYDVILFECFEMIGHFIDSAWVDLVGGDHFGKLVDHGNSLSGEFGWYSWVDGFECDLIPDILVKLVDNMLSYERADSRFHDSFYCFCYYNYELWGDENIMKIISLVPLVLLRKVVILDVCEVWGFIFYDC